MLGSGLMKLHADMRAPCVPGLLVHYALSMLRVHHLEMLEKAEHG